MDFFREIFRFFIAKEYSFTSKFLGILIVILVLFFIDNLLGFSFYYSNNQKITQLKNIEILKKECINDIKLLETLNRTEQKIIDRKNVVEIFLNLFSQEPFGKREHVAILSPDTVYIIKYDTIRLSERQDNLFRNYLYLDTLIKNKSHYIDSSLLSKRQVDTSNLIDSNKLNIKTINNQQREKEVLKKSRSRVWHTLSSSYILILVMLILPILPFTQNHLTGEC